MADPSPTAATTMPFARAWKRGSIHREIPWAAAVNVGASPTPSTKRPASRTASAAPVPEATPHDPALAWRSVAPTHDHAASVSTRRAPHRSASTPPGICIRAYPRRNALNTRPICTWLRASSRMMSTPTTDTLTRQR